MRKLIVVVLNLLALASCTLRQVERQDAAQARAPVREGAGVAPANAQEQEGGPVAGQTIYVPIYSHIYSRDKSRVINLTATLSIRNTDALSPLRITAARYYGTDGAQVREYVSAPLRLAPMASTDFVVAEDDTSGGVGANFIVEWDARSEVTEPVVEAVMISTASQLGISFVSTGRVIKSVGRRTPPTAGR